MPFQTFFNIQGFSPWLYNTWVLYTLGSLSPYVKNALILEYLTHFLLPGISSSLFLNRDHFSKLSLIVYSGTFPNPLWNFFCAFVSFIHDSMDKSYDKGRRLSTCECRLCLSHFPIPSTSWVLDTLCVMNRCLKNEQVKESMYLLKPNSDT